MASALFLQSEVQDPYALYAAQLQQQPLYYDAAHKIWAVYSYACCKELLAHPDAVIPPVQMHAQLNEYCIAIISRLVRLSNASGHAGRKQVVMHLLQQKQPAQVPALLDELLPVTNQPIATEWVNTVGKQLPALSLIRSFDFKEEDSRLIMQHIEHLVALMRPVTSGEQAIRINEPVKEIYRVTEKHVQKAGWNKVPNNFTTGAKKISKEEWLSLCVANLIGLFIQSYDAGRGLLSNVVLQLLRQPGVKDKIISDTPLIQQLVTETLRFDSPIHNTRRVAAKDMEIGKRVIKKGEHILVIIAAANRDAAQFENPAAFDIYRKNNDRHLSFGAGIHQCPANNTSVALATATLQYLLKRFRSIEWQQQSICYEALVNARLPKQLRIQLS